MATQTTTHQVVNYIQRKIAETRAEGEDILSLLADPQVAFCLQILDGTFADTAPSNPHKNNMHSELEQLNLVTGTNRFIENNLTSLSHL